MKNKKVIAMLTAAVVGITSSGFGVVYAEESEVQEELSSGEETEEEITEETEQVSVEETTIEMSEDGILVNGEAASEDPSSAVYVGAEIIYYHEGGDETYGEGDESDAHTAEEAAANTVITITQPGTYRVSGTLKGQIAIDLGEDSRTDPSAVVDLVLDNAEITCDVASAIVVYNAYECAEEEAEASETVDTTEAGVNLIVADGSENNVEGSYVAKIYEEGTTAEQVEVGEAKKAYKFDAAIDSLVSFNINGETAGDGILNVTSDNEGIETSKHITINGGTININSSDDSINANEDGISVITINGGVITCDAGLGQEGDGIDSNGWIVVNGGYTIASANGNSQDSGIDSDLGIYINGGTVLASGNMYDEISEDSAQSFVVLNFSEKIDEDQILLFKDSEDNAVTAFSAVNSYQMVVYSDANLTEGDYSLYKVSSVTGLLNGTIYTDITETEGEVQLAYTGTNIMGMGGGMMQPGQNMGEAPEMPEDGEMPERPEGEEGEAPEMPEDGEMPERPEGEEGEAPEMPADGEMPERPEGEEGEAPEMTTDGEMPEGFDGEMPQMPGDFAEQGDPSTVFTITTGRNVFSGIKAAADFEEAETSEETSDDTEV